MERATKNSKWVWLGKKVDAAGRVWSMWEDKGEKIVKRSTPSNCGGNIHITLYWKRGTFHDGDVSRPCWWHTMRRLKEELSQQMLQQ
jgi:hypothetical protein